MAWTPPPLDNNEEPEPSSSFNNNKPQKPADEFSKILKLFADKLSGMLAPVKARLNNVKISKKTKIAIGAVFGVLILMYAVSSYLQAHPSMKKFERMARVFIEKNAIAQFDEKTLNKLGHITKISSTKQDNSTSDEVNLKISAEYQFREPLYVPVDSEEYKNFLKNQGLDLSVFDKIDTIMKRNDADQIFRSAGISDIFFATLEQLKNIHLITSEIPQINQPSTNENFKENSVIRAEVIPMQSIQYTTTVAADVHLIQPITIENLKGKYIILKQSVPSQYTLPLNGTACFRKNNNKGWDITWKDSTTDTVLTGSPLTSFPETALVIDQPETTEKIKSLITSSNEVLAKLEQSCEQRNREIAEQQTKCLDIIKSGTLFVGTAQKNNNSNPQLIYLEITDLNTERNTLRALLRNDGGWDGTRRFEGTYNFLNAGDNATLALLLNTKSEQAMQNAGPFIEWNENYTISLIANDGNNLSGKVGDWMFRMKHISNDEAKAKEIASARQTEMEWMEATKVGAIYKVLARCPNRGWSEEYDFIFVKNDKNGIVVEAILEMPQRGWRRAFTGTLVTNKYLAENRPLRLFSNSSQGVREARNQDNYDLVNPFSTNWDFKWYPLLDAGKMRFDYHITGQGDVYLEWTPVESSSQVQRPPATVDTGKQTNTVSSSATPATTPAPAVSIPSQKRIVAEDITAATQQATQTTTAMPTFPQATGLYALSNGEWKSLSIDSVLDRTENVSRGFLYDPESPYPVQRLIYKFSEKNTIKVSKTPVIVMRGVGQETPHPTLVTKTPIYFTLKVNKIAVDLYEEILIYYPRQRLYTMQNEVDIKVEHRENDLDIITYPTPLEPGFYCVFGYIFEVIDSNITS